MGLGIFTGAGISGAEPSGLPMGYRLRNEILETCHGAAQRATGTCDTAALPLVVGGDWKLEYVIGRLLGTIGSDAVSVLATLSVEVPNDAQMLLAAHLLTGGVQLTLNFDRGVEVAYGLLAGTATLPATAPASYLQALTRWRLHLPGPAPSLAVIGTRSQLKEWLEQRTKPALIKIHGTLDIDPGTGNLIPRDVAVVDEVQLMFLSGDQLGALDELARCDQILVTGYSGNDIDCYEPLLERLSADHFHWVAPDNGTVETRVRGIDALQPTAGHASTWLRSQTPVEPPTWPTDPLPGPGWIDRYREWETEVLHAHGDLALAEAFGWMLHDAGEHDQAISLLEAVLARRATPSTRIRLANAVYDRNRPGDKRDAARHYLKVAATRGPSGGVRTLALIRYGETHRPQAIHGAPLAVLAAVGGPTLALLIARRDGATAAQRALAHNVIGHLGLRIIEQVAPTAWKQPILRQVVGIVSAVIASSLASARRLLETNADQAGNRSVFLQQQTIEAETLAALFKRRPPAPAAAATLEQIQLAYQRMPDQRGVANTHAALALVAMAQHSLNVADQHLTAAQQNYRRPDGTTDPSGAELVRRRRRLLAAIT